MWTVSILLYKVLYEQVPKKGHMVECVSLFIGLTRRYIISREYEWYEYCTLYDTYNTDVVVCILTNCIMR